MDAVEAESLEILDAGSTNSSGPKALSQLRGLIKIQLDKKLKVHEELLQKHPNVVVLQVNHGKIKAAIALRTEIEHQLGTAPAEQRALWTDLTNPDVGGIDFTKVSDIGPSLCKALAKAEARQTQNQLEINAMCMRMQAIVVCVQEAYQYWVKFDWSLVSGAAALAIANCWGGANSMVLCDICENHIKVATESLNGGKNGDDTLRTATNDLATAFMNITSSMVMVNGMKDLSKIWERQWPILSLLVNCGEKSHAEHLTKTFKVYVAMREFYKMEYIADKQKLESCQADQNAKDRLHSYSSAMGNTLCPHWPFNRQICYDLLDQSLQASDSSSRGLYRHMVLSHFEQEEELDNWLMEWGGVSNGKYNVQALDMRWLLALQKGKYDLASQCAFELASKDQSSLQRKKVQLLTAQALQRAAGNNVGVLQQVQLAQVDLQVHLQDRVARQANPQVRNAICMLLGAADSVLGPAQLMRAYISYLQLQGEAIAANLQHTSWAAEAAYYVDDHVALLEFLQQTEAESPEAGNDAKVLRDQTWQLVVALDGSPTDNVAGTGLWDTLSEAFEHQGLVLVGTEAISAETIINSTLASAVLSRLLSVVEPNDSLLPTADYVAAICPARADVLRALWAAYSL